MREAVPGLTKSFEGADGDVKVELPVYEHWQRVGGTPKPAS